MKQKHEGKRIINWHRPLRSYELRQRYHRIRYAEPKVDDFDDEENGNEFY